MNHASIRHHLIQCVSLAPLGLTPNEIGKSFRYTASRTRVRVEVYGPILDQLVEEGLITLKWIATGRKVGAHYFPREVNPPCDLCGTTGNGPARVEARRLKIKGKICLECLRELRIEAEKLRMARKRYRDNKRYAAVVSAESRPMTDEPPEPKPMAVPLDPEEAARLAKLPDADRRFGLVGDHKTEWEAIGEEKIAHSPLAGVVRCDGLRPNRDYSETLRR
jgi:hypothetical protein